MLTLKLFELLLEWEDLDAPELDTPESILAWEAMLALSND